MKKNLFLMFVLLCAAAQGAWADEWDAVYTMTQTTADNWTALEASSTGRTLGSSGTTTYHYATGDVTFTNSNAGGSGLTILGTVYLYVPEGVTVTCIGANANGTTGAGAGVELSLGNSLYLLGSGTLNATGGNAANGSPGGPGGDATGDDGDWTQTGAGGTGGNGGGGAGAGIGTRGGAGGSGGAGGGGNHYDDGKEDDAFGGTNGTSGSAGATAGAMGALYVSNAITVSATGGHAGSSGGSGGQRGRGYAYDGYSYNVTVAGGGGGGAGGFGGAASNIGTGGPGGGGGGGGAGGAQDFRSNSKGGVYDVTAPGGHGGQNANGGYADDGTEAGTNGTAQSQGWVTVDNGSFDSGDWNPASGDAPAGTAGNGGGCGHASSNGSAVNLVLWPTQGAGTEESPYLISSADDWNTFVTSVNNGISFSGKVIKLTNDISVSNMAGSYQADDNYQPFSGIFDGGGYTLTINVSNQSRFAAPFKCVSGATIRNLHTTGTIDGTGNTDGKLLAGLIGVSFGNTTITGCRSSMTLTTNFGEDAAMAGLVAGTKGGSLTIEGCVFDGEMLGTTNTRCAGISGYEYTATNTTISYTLFAPKTLTVSTTDDSYTKTFSRDGDATITNCYYTQALGTAQGTSCNVASTTLNVMGALVYDYGMVKAYAGGFSFNGSSYYDSHAITSESTSLTSGTYTVYADVTVPSRITINKTVVLNLGEGATLHAPKGIEVCKTDSANLTINGPGALTIDGCNGEKSGIGAVYVGTIVINGGTINVKGGTYAAGIGGDCENKDGGIITINGGVVNARGGRKAAGIGSGLGGVDGGWFHGGVCGNITINGGQVSAWGGDGDWDIGTIAGIGPGEAFRVPSMGTLTLGWTNAKDDFVYSTGYVSYPNEPRLMRGLTKITFNNPFILDGTATIATRDNIGGWKIVPYISGQATLSGSGTEADPWLIYTTQDWNALAQNVLNEHSYSGEYVKLMDDIDIEKYVGVVDARPFSGTFLGNGHTITASLNGSYQGHAPFRYINGATIRDLTVAGTIASNQKHTSGLVGYADGNNLIENCIVNATLNISSDYAGGIIGHGLTSNTTVKDCIFAGTVNGVDGNRSNIGGIWGWSTSGTPTLLNCLEKGTYTNIASMHPIGLQGNSGSISQPCYHLTSPIGSPANACAVSGAFQSYTVNTVEGEMLHPLLLVDGNTYYTPCSIIVDDYYHRTGSSVSITPVVTASDGTQLTLGTNFKATLNGENVETFPIDITTLGSKTFTVTGLDYCTGSKSVDFLVCGFNGEGTEGNPYTISNTTEWIAFVTEVNSGNNCSGKYLELTADIDITTPVGSRVSDSDNKPFSGTFLGGGHTITTTLDDDGNQGLAPFRYINGATIKDLTMAGTVNTKQRHSSGLVGFADGTNLIENCKVTTTITINCDYAGGFVGHGLSSATTIRNCTFAGKFIGISWQTNQSGYTTTYIPKNIGSFWGWSDNATPSLENCLEIGSFSNFNNYHPMGLLGGNGTLNNCYYKSTPYRTSANAWTVIPGSEYGRIYAEPSATEIRRLIPINGTQVYSDNCSVGCDRDSYNTNVPTTFVLTEKYNNSALVYGTDYTATFDDVAVESMPVTISDAGRHTMVFTGKGNYVGSKSISFVTFEGEGSAERPHQIQNVEEWKTFCELINNGTKNYSGEYVKLMADIDASEAMAGSSESNSFQGTFLGNGHTLTFTVDRDKLNNYTNAEEYCAPFRFVKDATIKDLNVEGNIYTSKLYAGGLVSHSDGTTNVIDCQVGTRINSKEEANNVQYGYHGGIVGKAKNTLNITGCVFNGVILAAVNEYHYNYRPCGGFVGYNDNADISITNSLFAPIEASSNKITNGSTFVNGGSATLINCYYTETMGSAQGSQVSTISAGDGVTVAIADAVSSEYSISGLSFYTTGVLYDNKIWAANNTEVSLNLDGTIYGHTITGFTPSAGTLTGSANPYTLTMPNSNVTINAASWTSNELPGTGTLEDPYTISNDTEWEDFCVNSWGGNNYSGKYVELKNDISATEMAGASETYSFQGIFLGNGHTLTFTRGSSQDLFGKQYCAPFRYVKDATIQDLKVAGDIYTSQKFAAGLVARSYGTTMVTNCQLTTVIHSSVEGDGTHGGIVSMPNGTLTIEGCAYTGRLLTNSGTTNCGGFVAWHNSATISVINSLYAPAGDISSGWSAINDGATFVRGGSPTITNCYYTVMMGDSQGTQASAFTSDRYTLGNLVQDYSNLKAYENGILYNDMYYVGPAIPTGTGTEADPYLIRDDYEWFSFTYYVNNGNDYSGKYVKLTADIDITTPAGYRASDNYNQPFSGTFLGDGHTITVTLDDDGNQGLALFRYINGATIKDLKVTGTIASSQYHTSGLVGFASGTNLIENCIVTATLNISSDYAGGIIGHGLTSATTIRGCAFTGTVNGVDGNRENIGGIWGWSNSGTPKLEGCLENGTYTNIASMHPMGLQGGSGTITNCYYVNPQVGSPRNACTVSGAKQAYTAATTPANIGSEVQDYGTLTAYENGILYDGTYYVAPASISLANAADNSTTISNANGYVANVTLSGRTLYKDGAWNTLCLPFNVNNFTGTPLEDATVMELGNSGGCKTGFDSATGTLTLDFVDANMIEAGHAYIVMWTKPSGYDGHASDFDISNPVFNGVTVVNENPANQKVVSQDGYVQFIGTYSPVNIYTAEKTNLYLGADNTLYYPWGNAMTSFNINSFRAYFQLLNGLTAGDPGNGVRAINLNFGEGSEETIISPAKIAERADVWYTIDGVKLNGKPNVKGLYINNGRKVVIK